MRGTVRPPNRQRVHDNRHYRAYRVVADGSFPSTTEGGSHDQEVCWLVAVPTLEVFAQVGSRQGDGERAEDHAAEDQDGTDGPQSVPVAG